MTRSQAFAHNTGVASAIAFASALAEDIRASIADTPERQAAIAALEVVIEQSPRLMLPVPPIVCGDAAEPNPFRDAQYGGGTRIGVE